MVKENNATRIHRELLVGLGRRLLAGALPQGLDRLPVEMRPKRSAQARLRCCVHAERAVLRGRIQALLGFPAEACRDECRPLEDFAREALGRRARDPRLLTVLEEACEACAPGKHFVSNACRGCMAQPCMVNCPRQAIRREDGHALIDPDRCVDCGRCRELCPYGAIVKIAVPCEQACPVEAITLAADGPRSIDPERCIACGRCMTACPFGAVAEVSELVEVLSALQRGEPMVALWAPALAAQFEAAPAQVEAAILRLGFHASLPVAAGADLAAAREAEELQERLAAGEPCMTSSCCPAFTGLIHSRFPALSPRVSTTPTPLQFTAGLARERHPGLRLVFLSPCVAKRREVLESGAAHHVLTLEELGAAFVAAGIDVASCAEAGLPPGGSPLAYGFAAAGGVRDAILARLPEGAQVTSESLSGLGPDAQRSLRAYANGRGAARFLEGMACAAGCISGPCTLADPRTAGRRMARAAGPEAKASGA